MAHVQPSTLESGIPLTSRSSDGAGQSNGGLFSIILGTVAGVIIVCCVLWATFPEIRKRFPTKPSRTKFNDGSVLVSSNLRYQYPRVNQQKTHTFPAHPAVCPPRPVRSFPKLVSKPDAVRTYNPRTETPFPGSPPHGEPVKLPAIYTPRPQSPVNTLPSTCSHGLFSPAVARKKPGPGLEEPKYHTVPKTSTAGRSGRQTGISTDFGDAKNYILAIPEPLSCKTKVDPGIGNIHNVYQTQELTQIPSSDSAKLLHPNKLFRALKAQEMRKSDCSSTSLRVNHRESDYAAANTNEVLQLVDDAIEANENTRTLNRCESRKKAMAHAELNSSEQSLTNSAILHRLESYKSLIGGPPPRLVRAGTVSRPKTPVHDMLRVFDNESYDKEAVLPSGAHIPSHPSSSSLPNVLDSSGLGSVSTSPSTPPEISSNLQMLPTPLHIKRTGIVLASSDTSSQQALTTKPRSIAQLRQEAEMSRLRRKDVESKLKQRRSRSLQQASRRQRPSPLKLPMISHGKAKRRSFAFFRDSMLSPMLKTKALRASIPGSSMYSRDTRGFSIVKTPLSADFPNMNAASRSGTHSGDNLRTAPSESYNKAGLEGRSNAGIEADPAAPAKLKQAPLERQRHLATVTSETARRV